MNLKSALEKLKKKIVLKLLSLRNCKQEKEVEAHKRVLFVSRPFDFMFQPQFLQQPERVLPTANSYLYVGEYGISFVWEIELIT